MTPAPTRVLVVEDSATQAAALAVLLEREGFETLVARRAERIGLGMGRSSISNRIEHPE